MSTIHTTQIILWSEYIIQNDPIMPRKVWLNSISLTLFAAFSYGKMLLTKKLIQRKIDYILNNADIVSLGSTRHGEKSKLKYAFMLLY